MSQTQSNPSLTQQDVTYGIVRAWHSVEWSDSDRILVNNVKVSIVLGLDELAQLLLLRSAETRQTREKKVSAKIVFIGC